MSTAALKPSRFPVRDRLQEYLNMAQQEKPNTTVIPRIRRINPTPKPNTREPIYQTTVVDIPGIRNVIGEFKTLENDVAKFDMYRKNGDSEKTARLREKIVQRMEDACVKARDHMVYAEHWRWDYKNIPLLLELLTIDVIKMMVAEAERLKAKKAAQAWRDLFSINATMDTLMLHHLKSVSRDKDGNWQITYQHNKSDTDHWEFFPLFGDYPKSKLKEKAFFMLAFIASAWLEFKPLSTDASPHAPDMDVLFLAINRIRSLHGEMLMLAYEPKIITGGGSRSGASDGGKARAAKMGLDHAAIRQAVQDKINNRRKRTGKHQGDLTAVRRAVANSYSCSLRTVEEASKGIK